MKKNVVLHKSTYLPIYSELMLSLIVARDAVKAHDDFVEKILQCRIDPKARGTFSARACSGDNGLFALFFHNNSLLTHRTIAHEIDHIVGFVLDYINYQPSPADEPRAFLTGYFHGWVYAQLHKARIRIGRSYE